MDGSLVIMKGSLLLSFCHYNRLQPCHFGMQSVVENFVTPMDGNLDIMEGRLLSSFYLFQWMVTSSLWQVVYCWDFYYSNIWNPCLYGRQYVIGIFVTPMNGSLVIMGGSMLSRFLLLQQMVSWSSWKVVCCLDIFLFHWMVALSLWKVVCSRYFCYSNRWQPCHYGRQSVVEIFVTLMDGSLVIMEGSLFSRILLLQLMVALSLWKVVCCRDFFTPMDGSLVIM